MDELGKIDRTDAAYLDTSDDLEHGLAEFRIAEARGAELILMDDFDTKARLAVEHAVKSGWRVSREGRLTAVSRV